MPDDLTLLTLAGLHACVTSLQAHAPAIGPAQARVLDELYARLLAVQRAVVCGAEGEVPGCACPSRVDPVSDPAR